MTRLICPFESCRHFNGKCILAEVKPQRIRYTNTTSSRLMQCPHYEAKPIEDTLDTAYRNGQKLVKQIADEYKLAMPDAANLVIKQLTKELDIPEARECEPDER